MPSLSIIYASTSGHTEYVVSILADTLTKEATGWSMAVKKAELAQPDDLLKGDVLILASSTWNTGGQEGQLNPHMFALLKDRAKTIALNGKKIALIGLGDHRYHYTVGALKYLQEFVDLHGGQSFVDPLRIVNEPYGQEGSVTDWGKKLIAALA